VGDYAGAIIGAMERIRRYFDRISRKHTLESAALMVLSFSTLCALGIFELIRSHKKGDQPFFYWGICLAAMALLGILLSSLLIRTVVRRLKADSQRDL
jgi:CDP-diglyceride synthetase